MAEIAVNTPPVEARARASPWAVYLPPLIFLGLMIIAAGFTAITLRPLKVLGVPYPAAMDYAHVIAPVGCAMLWLATLR